MEIVKYDIIDKIPNNKKPFFDMKRGFFVFRLEKEYKYFCQAKTYNRDTYNYDYFLLLGKTKFNDSCRKCYKDDIGRYKIRPTKDIKDYLTIGASNGNNFDLIYVESTELYDVWQIN